MKPYSASVPIFILSFHRILMTIRCLMYLKNRTLIPHTVHVLDNCSSNTEQEELFKAYQLGLCSSLNLLNWNSGCLYPKIVQHAMAIGSDFFVFNDNDVYCPNINPCWLTLLLQEMELYPDLGCIAAQLPPQSFQQPYQVRGNHTLCRAVGNTLKLVRTSAWPISLTASQKYGDDSLLCTLMAQAGYKTAYHNTVWCLHAGQTKNWGYQEEQIKEDPRKVGYGEPYTYSYNSETFEPLS